MRNSKSAEELFQEACSLYFTPGASAPERRKGLDLFRRAANQHHAEAMFLFGRSILTDKKLGLMITEQTIRTAWASIYNAAVFGSLSAKHFLDQVCRERYEEAFPPQESAMEAGPLKDSDGKVIRIKRTGLLTPVDAVLDYQNGENVLTLSADLVFETLEKLEDADSEDAFCKTVIEGFREWEGSYEVFGGQKVRIRTEFSVNQNSFDRVRIIAGDQELDRMIMDAFQKAPWTDQTAYENSAAVTSIGFRKWTARSRKFILFRHAGKLIQDPERLKHYAKHEFGHVLGLGDLYQSAAHGLKGTESEGFAELETYEIIPQKYNLVMDRRMVKAVICAASSAFFFCMLTTAAVAVAEGKAALKTKASFKGAAIGSQPTARKVSRGQRSSFNIEKRTRRLFFRILVRLLPPSSMPTSSMERGVVAAPSESIGPAISSGSCIPVNIRKMPIRQATVQGVTRARRDRADPPDTCVPYSSCKMPPVYRKMIMAI